MEARRDAVLDLFDKIGDVYGEIRKEGCPVDGGMRKGSGRVVVGGDGDDEGVVLWSGLDLSRVVRYDNGLVSIGRVSMRLFTNLTF